MVQVDKKIAALQGNKTTIGIALDLTLKATRNAGQLHKKQEESKQLESEVWELFNKLSEFNRQGIEVEYIDE